MNEFDDTLKFFTGIAEAVTCLLSLLFYAIIAEESFR